MALPGVEEGTSYGTPAFKFKGTLFARLRPDLDALVLRMPFAEREALLSRDPETFFITDHYVEYEWILVRLATVGKATLRKALDAGYAAAVAGRARRGR